jgi:hypothetical protein
MTQGAKPICLNKFVLPLAIFAVIANWFVHPKVV